MFSVLGTVGAQAQPFAAVVMDARTGRVLHSVNGNTRLHPASLTKMMTLYVAFEAIRNGEISLDTMVRVSRRAASEPPSRLGLREGQRIAMRHLIRGAALRSGNDAATAIAEAVSGSVDAFAARMNRTAAALGMSHTSFRNAHGLTASGHLSSARDMTLLGRQLYFDFPEYYNIFSRRVEDAGVAQVRNTNTRFLDGYAGADGIKTGYTSAAGYNLTAMAERGSVRIIVTVFGGRSVQHRHEQVVSLMNRGFREAPSRASVRRPARPQYGRQTEAVAQASAQAQGETRAAGRVIRLQTAPNRTPFPRRSPRAAPEAPPVTTVAMTSGIDAALQQVAAQTARASAQETLEAEANSRALAAAATETADASTTTPAAERAPERSPLPRNRPVALAEAAAPVAVAALSPEAQAAALAEADVLAARAAGFTVVDPEVFAALSQPVQAAAAPVEPAVSEAVVEAVAAAIAGAESEVPGAVAIATTPIPPARPEALALPPATEEAETAIAAAPPVEAPVAGEAMAPETTELAALAPEAPMSPDAQPAPRRHSAADLAGITIDNGRVVIPGLPAIDTRREAMEPAPELAPVAALAEPGLVFTAAGQVLWQDEERAVEAAPPTPVSAGPSAIVLTSADSAGLDPIPAPVPARALPGEQVVIRTAPESGGWAVELGAYGSRFDAERSLLRLALAESSTLGGGTRHVGERGGRYVAQVTRLSEEQAARACARLDTLGQSCSVVAP